jgi:hypothetical protein
MTIVGSRRIVDDGTELIDPGLMAAGVVLAGASIAATPILATYMYTTLVWQNDDARIAGLGTALGVSIAMGIASIPMWIIGGSRTQKPPAATTSSASVPTMSISPFGFSATWELE